MDLLRPPIGSLCPLSRLLSSQDRVIGANSGKSAPTQLLHSKRTQNWRGWVQWSRDELLRAPLPCPLTSVAQQRMRTIKFWMNLNSLNVIEFYWIFVCDYKTAQCKCDLFQTSHPIICKDNTPHKIVTHCIHEANLIPWWPPPTWILIQISAYVTAQKWVTGQITLTAENFCNPNPNFVKSCWIVMNR